MHKIVYPSRETVEAIARAVPTPFHLYDAGMLRRRARALNAAFSWNPGFCEYFAVKANPNPYVMDILKAEGCGADCASLTELMLARAVGLHGDRIMFSSNDTPAEEYELARQLDATINLDDITMIPYLAKHGGIPQRISLRYNPGGDVAISNSVMGHPGDAKFGMTRDQIFESVEKLSALGVKEFALHSFLVSNALDPTYYPGMAALLMQLALDIFRQTGRRVSMINLSGGLGIPYRPEEDAPEIGKVGKAVREMYEWYINGTELAPMRIACELGRWMTGPCGWLVTRAIHEKRIHKHYIGVDASACDLMRPAMYGAYHHITVCGKETDRADQLYDVVGSLCENNDKFCIDRMLPKIDIGDLLLIHDAGAHGRAMGYNYNGKMRCGEVLLEEDGSFRVIRRAETPADYFATLDYPGLV